MTVETEPTTTPETNETNALLRQVLARLDALEAKVDRVTAVTAPMPKLVSGAVDTVDDLVRAGRARGVDLDEHLHAGAHLLERLSEPKVVEAITQLLDRAETLAGVVDQLAELPHLAAMAGDMADGWVKARMREGIDPDAALKGLGALARTMSRPEVMRAAERLSERLPDLAKLAEDGPKLLAMAMDAFDELAERAARQGLEPDAVLKSFLTVGLRVTEVLDSPQFKALLSSDVLAPATLEVVGRAGRALTEQSSATCGRTGIVGALGASRDEDIQRALYFLIGFAQRFGREMNCAAPAASLETGSAARHR